MTTELQHKALEYTALQAAILQDELIKIREKITPLNHPDGKVLKIELTNSYARAGSIKDWLNAILIESE